jgi:hypothetical protein
MPSDTRIHKVINAFTNELVCCISANDEKPDMIWVTEELAARLKMMDTSKMTSRELEKLSEQVTAETFRKKS